MKQVIQNLKSGELKVDDVPRPQIKPTFVLVRTLYSAISAGTEKTTVDTAKKTLFEKARARPDLVKKVVQKVSKDGLWNTFQMVMNRLGEPKALGYSAVGVVEEVGEWVEGIQVGDIVACAGAGYANHAEYNIIPARLAARCPANVPLDQAAFTTIGSIALQGIRQTDPKLGEKIVVLGMGLIGQITAELLKINGCEVLGIDLDPWKLEQAKKAGCVTHAMLATDPTLQDTIMKWTKGIGADAVILTAGTTSDGPIEQAGIFCRDKGRVVIVGAVGTKFPREPYFAKEVDIRIARSYGPGRYDPFYEELGLDYPAGFVRFTEQRNMETFVELLATKRLDLSRIITHRFPVENAPDAYNLISNNSTTQEPYLGIVLEYPKEKPVQRPVKNTERTASTTNTNPMEVGFVGLGNYATAQLIPALQKVDGVKLTDLVTGSGMSAATKAKQYKFRNVAETPQEVFGSINNGTVFVATRHDSHAKYVCEALEAGKNVFVEKPLCLYIEELETIQNAYDASNGVLGIGFNRRFSPHVQKARALFPNGAEHILYRVNAGKLPKNHWVKMPEIGGGRIIGEGCHFVDLASYFARSPIASVYAKATGMANNSIASTEDCHIFLSFENGATATILYMSSGNSKVPKEYIEVHGGGQSAIVQDFFGVTINGVEDKKPNATQDKGQTALVQSFMTACKNGDRNQAPIPASEIWGTTVATLAVIESLKTGKPIRLNPAVIH
jgi:predicted dehydrogenase/threonine dehydrogenase-like Zn-dependent dehydrogenase